MKHQNKSVLCLNAGSSSVKFELFDALADNKLKLRFRGQLEGIGDKPAIAAQDADGNTIVNQTFSAQDIPDVEAGLPQITALLNQQMHGKIPDIIGHRIVTGGTRFPEPVVIDKDIVSYLEKLVPLMPLHLPPELDLISAVMKQLPNLPQVGVFDTSFHHGHDLLHQRIAIPQSLHDEGVLNYGYHGISYEYIARRFKEIDAKSASGRVIVAHLGSGCSMCAMRDGKSVETSMKFSALDGLIMGTRPGRLDPGVLLYLLQIKGMSPEQINHLLYHECGLKGLSGISNDARELLESSDPRAAFAVDSFCHSAATTIAALATAIGGIDSLVFTAGIGEHAAPIRSKIIDRLAWLGAQIDANANAKNAQLISSPKSTFACYVIPTNEELMIAHHALNILNTKASIST